MVYSYEDFLRDLGISESSGRYDIVNKQGYAGKYQMGEQALVAAGYYKPKKIYNNKWDGEFTGKDEVYSINDFLKNKQAQENAIRDFQYSHWQEYKNRKDDAYIGKTIKNDRVTPSGMLASSHLKGTSSVDLYLRNNGNIPDNIRCDANHTCIEDYMHKFSNYDVTPITNRKSSIDSTKKNVTQKSNQKHLTYLNTKSIPKKSKQDIFKYILNPYRNLNERNSVIFKNKKSSPTGFAAPVDNIFTPEQIGSMSPSEFNQNESAIMNQMEQGFIHNPEVDLINKYSGYTNPLSGSNRIFSAEDIGALSGAEFAQYEPEINAQWGSIGIPNKNELHSVSLSGGLVYVSGYTRADGTEVSGYYRSR